MERVKAWLAKRRCTLSIASDEKNEVVFEVGKRCHVYLSNRGTKQSQLATLLHECGHVVVWLRRSRNKTKRVFGASFNEWMGATGRCRARTKRAALATLQEEMAAWDLGEKLARRLKVRLPVKKFERERMRAVLTYLPS